MVIKVTVYRRMTLRGSATDSELQITQRHCIDSQLLCHEAGFKQIVNQQWDHNLLQRKGSSMRWSWSQSASIEHVKDPWAWTTIMHGPISLSLPWTESP